ncbi:hypothetical protein BOTBODRAFT_157432 [Botryobasidium botryosum FD-172 SS1]|uniref:Ubiquitin-like domain-containing protein n=1 Tax=Botryobasidium botryosum (strain FD-172 SS1) TaxID=930990 RepID=A0A067MW71_BOTB1|nr:hypothetical protein BOTBODRAFT_157432 [Botryobasidium botryosum FD-172 SS1]
MEIFVKIPSGKITLFEVNPSDTIRSLKAQIEDEEGIPSDKQYFIHAGEQLEDDRTFAEYHIVNDAVLILLFRLRDVLFEYLVCTRSGKIALFEVSPSDTIGFLKAQIEDEEGIPSGKQYFIHAGEQLEDDRTFAEYHVVNGKHATRLQSISIIPSDRT